MEKKPKTIKKKFIEKLNEMKNIIEKEIENEDIKKVYDEYILFEENSKILSKDIKTYFMQKEVEDKKISENNNINENSKNRFIV